MKLQHDLFRVKEALVNGKETKLKSHQKFALILHKAYNKPLEEAVVISSLDYLLKKAKSFGLERSEVLQILQEIKEELKKEAEKEVINNACS